MKRLVFLSIFIMGCTVRDNEVKTAITRGYRDCQVIMKIAKTKGDSAMLLGVRPFTVPENTCHEILQTNFRNLP